MIKSDAQKEKNETGGLRIEGFRQALAKKREQRLTCKGARGQR